MFGSRGSARIVWTLMLWGQTHCGLETSLLPFHHKAPKRSHLAGQPDLDAQILLHSSLTHCWTHRLVIFSQISTAHWVWLFNCSYFVWCIVSDKSCADRTSRISRRRLTHIFLKDLLFKILQLDTQFSATPPDIHRLSQSNLFHKFKQILSIISSISFGQTLRDLYELGQEPHLLTSLVYQKILKFWSSHFHWFAIFEYSHI